MSHNPRLQPASLVEHIKTVRDDSTSLSDMLDAFQERFESIEPEIHSFVPEANRFDRLRKDAQNLEQLYLDPESRPPLYGALIGVKDIFHVDGFETRAGTQVPSDLFAGSQAAVVSKLRQAGALIAGKTVTTEFAYFEPGPTRNPHNLDHTPGGSSSGSAAAIASGLVHLALGTQTVGSVIRPAAYCGIVGYKPSFDHIDTAGLVYFSRSADHVGLFTQDVAGLQIVAPIVVNDWQNKKPQQRPILAVPDDAYLQQSTALTEFESHIKQLEDANYTITRIPMFADIQAIDALHNDMTATELAIEHREWFQQYHDLYRPRTAQLIRKGQGITSERLDEARQSRLKVRERLHNAMAENNIDLWISPSASDVAPEGIASTGSPVMNLPWTHSGLPAVTVPAGSGDKGLPLGLQLCARFGNDEALLTWSQDIASIFSA